MKCSQATRTKNQSILSEVSPACCVFLVVASLAQAKSIANPHHSVPIVLSALGIGKPSASSDQISLMMQPPDWRSMLVFRWGFTDVSQSPPNKWNKRALWTTKGIQRSQNNWCLQFKDVIRHRASWTPFNCQGAVALRGVIQRCLYCCALWPCWYQPSVLQEGHSWRSYHIPIILLPLMRHFKGDLTVWVQILLLKWGNGAGARKVKHSETRCYDTFILVMPNKHGPFWS